MKISQAIEMLKMAQDQVGDVDVMSLTEVDGHFCCEFERTFEIIQIPDEAENEITVVAFMEPPEEEKSGKPTLKIVKP